MWGPNNQMYFTSDRDGRMNLYSVDLTSKETKQLTSFKDFDIKFPSIGKDSIVFEQAGYIWRFDLASGKADQVPIKVAEDFASGRSAFLDASKHTESVNLAPDAQRAIVVARGDLFSVPAKEGTARNLAKTSGVHERDAVWSPDGKWIAYNSDVTGENELYVRSQDGKGQPQQLTNAADTYYYQAIWSPDSKKLLWADRRQRLRYVDVGSKAVTEVDQDKYGEIQGYDWSPDSQWIVFEAVRNSQSFLYVMRTSGGSWILITEGKHWDDKPLWSPDGKTIYYLSERGGFFNAWGIHFDPMTGQSVGKAFPVTSFDSPSLMVPIRIPGVDISLNREKLALTMEERSGSIWVLDNVEH